jgi:hypothetical protein
LLGIYGLSWAFKKRIPASWPHAELPDAEPSAVEEEDDEDEAEPDDEDDAEEEGDEGDEGADETDDAADAPTKKKDADDDVDSEFDEQGRLKRVRE